MPPMPVTGCGALARLDVAKAGLVDAEKRATKDATDWADAAKASAISKAQEFASSKVAAARSEAEAESEKIKKKGESELKAFEGSIAKNKGRASELVASRLLGEPR